MSKTIKSDLGIEIVVSTYWPTKILKSLYIKNTNLDHFRKDLELDKRGAEYLYTQLKALFEPEKEKQNHEETI